MGILELIHVTVALLLSATILLQHRASGLSAAFGGSGAGAYVQRRGAEKLIYQISIWLAVVFFGLSIVRWYV